MQDDETLAFYATNAAAYAQATRGAPPPMLAAFLDALPPRASILELGTGSGRDARTMLDRGFRLTATDGSADLAHEASTYLDHPVDVMRFADLDAQGLYDGVWASASLLHVPAAELSGILARVHRALTPGGLFVASYKAGDGPGRDDLGRYYNYPDRHTLECDYAFAATWQSVAITSRMGRGYDNAPTQWLWVTARR